MRNRTGSVYGTVWSLILIVLTFPLSQAAAQASPPLKTRNVILIMSDGLRWQELFSGADDRLFSKDEGVDDIPALRAAFWRDTPEERRAAMMPFFWSVIATQGQVYGNRTLGSDAHITNTAKVSYPGYSETFCGFPNPHIDANKRIHNPEATVFEWLHSKPSYKGRVAAFGAWDLFPFIFNTERCGFPVDDGLAPITFGKLSDRIETVNLLRAETPPRWGGASFDSLVFRPALEWIKLNKPRVAFLGLGETDEWAHAGEYDEYLKAARRVDAYLKELWDTLQSMPEYRDSTTLILTCDHGRGGGDYPGTVPKEWRDHNAKIVGAEEIWIAILGPDTPALGVRENIDPVTQSQIAATMAALLGEDYNAAEPRAGRVLPGVIRGSE